LKTLFDPNIESLNTNTRLDTKRKHIKLAEVSVNFRNDFRNQFIVSNKEFAESQLAKTENKGTRT